MADKIVPLLLAGGSGTRLWPVSRDSMPKQFLPIVGKRSTYQQALERTSSAELFAAPIVMTNDAFRFFARRQAQEMGIEPTVVLEPSRRDSGPAIAAGAMLARRLDPDAIVLALAADHVILDQDLFETACRRAAAVAATGRITMFGIQPTEPKTCYGYIRRGDPVAVEGAYAVSAFVEKPDAQTALQYVAEGLLWNSGLFVFRATALVDELGRFEPEMLRCIDEAVGQAQGDLGFVRLAPEAFNRAPAKSIDYAVMERTDKAAVIDVRFGWSDIGSWDAVLDVSERDERGNALRGLVAAVDAQDCIIHSEDRLTAVLGVRDLVVVTTSDAVLVLPRDRAQDVKGLVAKLKELDRPEVRDHRRCYRPWGYYESVDAGARFQVKRIAVLPGERLSLQKHMHRSEHWVVVRGTAEVTTGDLVRIVHENESVYVPIGTVHRLANPGRIPLELIEVQTGSYLGEDDIIRLEDIYQRR